MIRKRVPKLFTILATAACIFGLVLVTPTLSPTLSPMPTAGAVPLPNQYDVSCVGNGGNVVCTITGCPRVYEDYAGDVVHIKINGGPQEEIAKACGDPLVYTVGIPDTQGFNLAMQGCRKYTLSSDECGPFSDFKYVPPVQAPINCPPDSKTATVVPPAQCEALPKVICPDGSPTVDAVSLDKCAPVPNDVCPPGSTTADVAPGGECQPPSNAVSMTITKNGSNAAIVITNKSALPGTCDWNAQKQGFGFGPASVDRQVDLPANAPATIDDVAWPLPLVNYQGTVKCTGTWDGKQVTIGEDSAPLAG